MVFWDAWNVDRKCGCSSLFDACDQEVDEIIRRLSGSELTEGEANFFKWSFDWLNRAAIRGDYRAAIRDIAEARHYADVLSGLLRYPQVFSRPGLAVLFAAVTLGCLRVCEETYRKDERDTTTAILRSIVTAVEQLEAGVQSSCPPPCGGGARAAYLQTTSVEGRTGSDFVVFFHVTSADGRKQSIRPVLFQAKICGEDVKDGNGNVLHHHAQLNSDQTRRMEEMGVKSAYTFYHHDDEPTILVPTVMGIDAAKEQANERGVIRSVDSTKAMDMPTYFVAMLTLRVQDREFDDAALAVRTIMHRMDYDRNGIQALAVSDTGGSMFRELVIAMRKEMEVGRSKIQVSPEVPSPTGTPWTPAQGHLPDDFRPQLVRQPWSRAERVPRNQSRQEEFDM